jgi:hypothetical protein
MHRTEFSVLGATSVALSLVLTACGSDATEAAGGFAAGAASNGTAGSLNAGTGGSSPGAPASGGGGGLPPEQEIESAYRAPVVTGRYVWSANPESGRVAVIDPETLVVRLADAGLGPTELAALPERDGVDRAIVINAGSGEASLLRADDEALESTGKLPLHDGANAWAISKSGRWAIAWTEALRIKSPDPALGFQDLTLIDLENEEAFELSVGFRPSRVLFSEDEKRAFVVTEPGLSVLELDEVPRVSSLVELTEDPIVDPGSRDVSVTPDGALAFVRVEGSGVLGVVDLETAELGSRDLGGPITDLDLSSDGATLAAVVEGALVSLPATKDGALTGQVSFSPEILRSVSVSADSSFSILYTTAFENSHVGAVLVPDGDFESAVTRVIDVKAPVTSALVAPGSEHAIVLGKTPAGSTKAGVFAVVPAQMDRVVKVVGTDAPPVSMAFSASGEHALLSTRDDATGRYGAYVVELQNLAETFVPLKSPPSSIGVLPSGTAFVAQLHPEGRITFVDLASGAAHTLTGFELSAKVTQ